MGLVICTIFCYLLALHYCADKPPINVQMNRSPNGM